MRHPTGEVVARHYRHPADVDRAVKAGATWEQIAAARGCAEAQAREDYREWAESQHRLWTGELGDGPGRFGLDDDAYAAAITRAAEGQMEPDPAEVHGFGRNQPGPYDREPGQ